MSKQLLIYAPVIHRGIERLIEDELPADEILIVGQSFGEGIKDIRKEIRAVDPKRVADDLRARYHAPNIRVVEAAEWPRAAWADEVVAANDSVTTTIAGALPQEKVRLRQVFLRWDREWARAVKPPEWTGRVSVEEAHRIFLRQAFVSAERSSDWWRQVGAYVRTEDGQTFGAHNRHTPTEYAPYIDGDPRNAFSRGNSIELSTAIHAEPAVGAMAARHGVRLEGAKWAVTTFPCPPCARFVAETGASQLYFGGGYSMIEGERILRDAGTELIWVDMNEPPS